MILDKIIVSELEPENTGVIWIKPIKDSYEQYIFLNNKWVNINNVKEIFEIVSSVNNQNPDSNGNVNITKEHIGLGNVNNTSDTEKVVKGASEDGSGNNIAATYETKTDATTKQTTIQGAINALQTSVAALTGLDSTNFGGFSIQSTEADAISNIATLYTADGYTDELLWYMAGTSLSSVKAYRYNGSGTPTAISSDTYNCVDFSGLIADVSTLRQDLDALGPEIDRLEDKYDEILEISHASANLLDDATQTDLMVSNGAVISYNIIQSYIIPIQGGTTISFDRKLVGTRCIIYTFSELPAVGSVPLETVFANNNAASYGTIQTGQNAAYLLWVVDNSGTAVNMSDVRLYYGTEWSEGGSGINAIERLSASIEELEDKMDSIPSVKPYIYGEPQRKIFDVNEDTVVEGELVNGTTGVTAQDNKYIRTGYIEVLPNHKYRFAMEGIVAAYDESKSVIASGAHDASKREKVDFMYTTPAECKYIIFSARVLGAYIDNKPYFKIYDAEPSFKVLENGFDYKPLVGKKIVVFGDSIAGLNRAGWPLMVEDKVGATLYNCGFPGCRMSMLNGGDTQGTNPFSMVGLADAIISQDWSSQDSSPLLSSSSAIFQQASLALLKSIVNDGFEKIDTIIIAYGTNEAGYTQDDELNEENIYTYAGATRYALHKLMAAYPSLNVILLTPIYRYSWSSGVTNDDSDVHVHPTYGGRLTDNVQTLIDVAKEFKVTCLDMYYQLGINKYNRDNYYLDGTHLNHSGLMRYAGYVAYVLLRTI